MAKEKTVVDKIEAKKAKVEIVPTTKVEIPKVETKKPERGRDSNLIYIGKAEFMNYITACVMQLSRVGVKSIYICARGKYISRAVDVSQVVINKFGRAEIGKIELNSEDFQRRDGRNTKVSSIKIELKPL